MPRDNDDKGREDTAIISDVKVPLHTGLKVSGTVVRRRSFSSSSRMVILLLDGGKAVTGALAQYRRATIGGSKYDANK